ncbi:MAG: hypothetical protein AAF602_10105 [Myxococcota bacterium]
MLSCAGTLDGLGARIRRAGIEPGRTAMVRLAGRVQAHLRGTIRPAAFRRSVVASVGQLAP